jgi:hypothetical protein
VSQFVKVAAVPSAHIHVPSFVASVSPIHTELDFSATIAAFSAEVVTVARCPPFVTHDASASDQDKSGEEKNWNGPV